MKKAKAIKRVNQQIEKLQEHLVELNTAPNSDESGDELGDEHSEALSGCGVVFLTDVLAGEHHMNCIVRVLC